MMDTSIHAATASMTQGVSSTENLRGLANTDQRAALREATQQFEGLFIQMMLKTMRSTAGGGMFSSSATRTFQEMQDTEMAKRIAANGGLGLTEQIIDSVMQQAGIKSGAVTAPVDTAPQNTRTFLQSRGVAE